MKNWVVVDEKYLDYLRAVEPRIPRSNYGVDRYKPFFGILFEKGNLVYVSQISHAQERHHRMKNAPDFFKIYIPDRNPSEPDRLAAVVNLNYMFPIPKSLVKNLEYRDIASHRTFRSQIEKSQYIDLLTKELAQINKMEIEKSAVKLYQRKIRFPDDFVSRRCIDFCAMEKLAQDYLPIQP